MVHAVIFGEEIVEKVEPAAAAAYEIGQFVLDDGSLEGNGCGRHVERQGTDMLLAVSVFETNFCDRRKFAFQAGGEEAFVEDDVLDGVSVENRE